MTKFINALKEENNFTVTENMATALKSTNSSLVDLFGQIGAMRGRSDKEIEATFSKAFAEDKLLAIKMAFYARNIRGGLGERRVFRIIINFLGKLYPEVVRKNIQHIPHFGRWDDLYSLIDTDAESNMWKLIENQLQKDIMDAKNNNPISLLAKWLKSCNTSSPHSQALGRYTAFKLGLSEKKYRQTLSMLRKHIDVVESKMSRQDWMSIDYLGVPSRAMTIYRNAFKRHDEAGFGEFIQRVVAGEEKINASTLYPYDILERMGLNWSWSNSAGWEIEEEFFVLNNYDRVLEEQWKALPNYIDGENNVLIMADTSGSMVGRPIHTSVGLAIYFAERNKGVFANTFVTFSREPSLVELKGETLYEKIKCVPSIVENTDLEAAFALILDTAVKHNIGMKDMPKTLVIISDMQFDQQTNNPDMTWHDAMAEMFLQHGYQMPNIIYWNADSRRDTFQVTSQYKEVQLASGQSPAVFKSILQNIGKTPYQAMIDTLNSPEYDCIIV